MSATRVILLAALAVLGGAVLAPVATADVVVGVWICDPEAGYCTCRNVGVAGPVHYHRGCTIW